MPALRALVCGLLLLLCGAPLAAAEKQGLLVRGQAAGEALAVAEDLLGPEIDAQKMTVARREVVAHRYRFSQTHDLLLYEASGLLYQARLLPVATETLPAPNKNLRLFVPPRAYMICRHFGRVSYVEADTCDDFLKRKWAPAWEPSKK